MSNLKQLQQACDIAIRLLGEKGIVSDNLQIFINANNKLAVKFMGDGGYSVCTIDVEGICLVEILE